jgi:RND superfamily putative drug exporter
VSLRYFILLGWILAVGAAILYLPPLQSSGGAVGDLVPNHSPALQAERDATKLFGAPLNAPVAVVQRDPHGLSQATQEAALRHAVAIDTRQASQTGLAGALPVANTAGVFPGSRERSTTVITFLYFRPDISIADQTTGGQEYARRNARAPADHLVGVTGAIPATYAQGQIIGRYLPWVEVATVLAIALIVGLYFRSAGAPLATLLCSATAYLLATRVVAWTALRTKVSLPPDVEPVLVVLLLGVTTDYSVFFMAGMRNRLAEGIPRVRAARLTTAEYAPIILAAGLMVAAGAASLAAARMKLISAFGPALALTVLTAMVVSMTLAPVFIAIFGGLLFRPGPARVRRTAGAGEEPAIGGARALPWRKLRLPSSAWDPRERLARFATARPVALLIVAACTVGLLGAAWEARNLRLGSPLIRELPTNSAAARADAAASAGFAPGILSPTEILVLAPGVTGQGPALARLQRVLARQPGVAGVVGPADLPPPAQSLNVMLARSGNAARYGIIERTDPLGPTAVNRIQALKRDLPALARSAGLTGVRFEVGGETAVIGEAIDSTFANLGQIALVVLAITLVLLGIFLRAVIAPCYLLAASVLALLATLGVTVWIFQDRLGYGGLVYYVPFTVAVLLVSLGSDYNVFVVGRIWEEARRRPLRDAVAVAGSQASRTITVAGVALAASFALLAIIPLDQFREIAVAMAAGIIIDAIVVRSLLVPALVALFGRAGMWPGARRVASGTRGRRAGTAPEVSSPERALG